MPAPSNFRVYRRELALELSLSRPRPAEGGTYLEPGRLYLSIAQGSREGFEWRGALRLALAPGELGQILEGLDGAEVAIVHDPGAGTSTKGQVVKALKMRPGGEGRIMLSLGAKDRGEWRAAGTVALSPGDVAVVRELVRTAAPVLLGWAA
jgi:hypothetical protein